MDKKPNHPTNRSLKSFAKDFIRETLHIDRSIFQTIHSLLFKPGHLTLSYFKTSDRQYIQPLKLYFAINLLFFLLIPILSTSQFRIFSFDMESLTKDNPAYQRIIADQIQSNSVSAEIYEERFNAHLKYNQPALVFLIIPFFALILKMVYFKYKRYYLEHLYFSIHFLSFSLLSLLFSISLYRILKAALNLLSVSSNDMEAVIILLLFFLWFFIYLFIASRKFYQQKRTSSFFKTTILIIGFMIAFMIYLNILFFYTVLALSWGY